MVIVDIMYISLLWNFQWYRWVNFKKEDVAYPLTHEFIVVLLGLADNKFNEMYQRVLTEAGEILPFQTLRSLTPSDCKNPNEESSIKKFYEEIRKRFVDSRDPPANLFDRRRKPRDPDQYKDELFESEPGSVPNNFAVHEDKQNGKSREIPEADDILNLEMYINDEVLLPYNGEHM